MFAKLVESGARRNDGRRTLPGAMLSVALHAGAILSLMHVTRPDAPPLPPIVRGDDLVFLGPITRTIDRPRDEPVVGRLPDLPPGPALSEVDIPLVVPDGIPPVTSPSSVPRAPSHGPTGSILDPGGGWNPTDVFRSALVDEAPVRLSSPPIAYPPRLARAGIEGVVVIEAVVDTLGNVEPGSVRAVASDHAEFNAAAGRVVAQSRFRAGRERGRAVRVLIRLPVVFRLD